MIQKHLDDAKQEPEKVKVTREQLVAYKKHVERVVTMTQRDEEKLKQLMMRPQASKFDTKKKERNLRRLATVQQHIAEGIDLLAKIDLELLK